MEVFLGLVILFSSFAGCSANDPGLREFSLHKGTTQGVIPDSGFLEETFTQSEIECAIKCADTQNCTCLYYLEDTRECKTSDKKLNPAAGNLGSNPAVVYYELEEIEQYVFACPVDDSAFQWGQTSDGTAFQFRIFKDTIRNFDFSQANCHAHGANLYKVLTPEKMTFTLQLMSCPAYTSTSFWIDGRYVGGEWVTNVGAEPLELTSTFWPAGRPVNSTAAACVCLGDQFGYLFDDRTCGHEAYSICEIEL